MEKILNAIRKLSDPSTFSPLLVAVGLLVLCGIFNILYVMFHSPREFVAVISRIGAIPSNNLQSLTELIMVLTGYSMVTSGYYLLYSSSRRGGRGAKYSLASALLMIVVGSLLVMALYAQKRGGW